MFERGARSQHEPAPNELIEAILYRAAGGFGDRELARSLRERDRRLGLEVDSSQLNFFVIDVLQQEFPEARFLLTTRDPYSWLDSIINDSLRRRTSEEWLKMRDLRFGDRDVTWSKHEEVLERRGLYPLDGYLSYWAQHNETVLNTVSADRLLVVRTDRITREAFSIADFAGLPRDGVQLDRSHVFQNPETFDLLDQIEPSYLEDKVLHHCSTLMSRFFPEVGRRPRSV